MLMKLSKVILVLVFIPLIHYGQNSLNFPEDFSEVKVSQVYSDEWHLGNGAMDSYKVSADKAKLIVIISEPSTHCGIRNKSGTLIGINDGEFGGALYFNSIDSTKKPIFIKYGNIKFLFVYKNKIYFIEGLAHKSFSEGAMYELNSVGDKFTYKKLIQFDDAPQAFTIYKDKFLIATQSGFCIVRNFKKEVVVTDAFWRNLYPNSIAAINNKNFFIGIRGGIVHLNPSDKEVKLYKRN
jgi:hypothetical protein